MNALLIDDSSLYRALIAEVLRFEGINVHMAKDAEAVSAALQQNQFDLVFCDLHISGIDSLSLLASLRERFPALRVVALGRYSTSKQIHNDVLADTPFYLAKPFTIEALLHLVRDVVGMRGIRNRGPAVSGV